MSAHSNQEPLTLWTRSDLGGIYHRDEILRQRTLGALPRQRVDPWIAKVLPAGSALTLEEGPGPLRRVLACEYRPFFSKPLFALASGCAPSRLGEPLPRPLPAASEILAHLLRRVGTRYLFGGSAAEGSTLQETELIRLGYLRSEDRADPDLQRLLRSAGLDCSGLFNEATGYHFFGDTKDVYARFRSGFVRFPAAVAASPTRLAKELRPLDILLQRGHMILSLGDGRLVQAVGDGINATTFARETGHVGLPMAKYDRVVIDDAEPILTALLVRQGRRVPEEFRLDDVHLSVIRWLPSARGVPEA